MNSLVDMSPREERIFALLKKNGEMSLEDITEEISRKEGKPVRTGSINVAIKYMGYKLSGTNWRVTKTAGGRGSGNKSSFKLEKI